MIPAQGLAHQFAHGPVFFLASAAACLAKSGGMVIEQTLVAPIVVALNTLDDLAIRIAGLEEARRYSTSSDQSSSTCFTFAVNPSASAPSTSR
jgi:hypothetical protein